MRVVSCFADMFVVYRGINHRRWGQSSIRSAMFNLMKELRNPDLGHPEDLGKYLKDYLNRVYPDPFQDFDKFSLRMNRSFVYYFLSRITSFIEYKSENLGRLENNYLSYEVDIDVEHIIPDKYNLYIEEFENENDFNDFRNRVGGLLLLPSSFNRSYGALDYSSKREYYRSNNMLAQSLHEKAYERGVGLQKVITKYDFPFEPHSIFGKDEIMKRQELYKEIARVIWDPNRILKASEI